MARVGEAWKARRAMGVRWASSWRDSRAGRNEVAIVCEVEWRVDLLRQVQLPVCFKMSGTRQATRSVPTEWL